MQVKKKDRKKNLEYDDLPCDIGVHMQRSASVVFLYVYGAKS